MKPAGYGQDEMIYLDPALAVACGYFGKNDNRFTGFEIPDPLPQGDSEFEIHHAGVAYLHLAGVPFDSTTMIPTAPTPLC